MTPPRIYKGRDRLAHAFFSSSFFDEARAGGRATPDFGSGKGGVGDGPLTRGCASSPP